jgi:hypothetical protein
MPTHLHSRHFSLEDAEDTLPNIVPLLVRLQSALEEYQVQRRATVAHHKSAGTNGKRYANDRPDALARLDELTKQIESHGCVLKDFAQGLIDFPSIVDGREVYLCWRMGEGSITAWHELEAGFAGRMPIDDRSVFRNAG